MSTLLYRLGRAMARARVWVLIAWVALLAALGSGAALFQQGMETSFEIPGAQSQEALDHLGRVFPQMSGSHAQMVVTVGEGQRIDSPQPSQAIKSTVDQLSSWPEVSAAMNPLSHKTRDFISPDGRSVLMMVQVKTEPTNAPPQLKQALTDVGQNLERQLGPGSDVHVGGDIFSVNMPAMGATEGVGVVIALVVLLLMLRSLVGAVMPLITALVGVGVSGALVLLATLVTPVSTAAPMLGIMLGLAVGIDYSLFIVSRHREQLADGLDVEESIARATATAGSAVIFAGLTVIIALLALAVPGLPFLTTMGALAGIAIAVGVAVALTMIPALLAFAGTRLRPRVKKPRAATKPSRRAPRVSWSRRWVRAVTKIPVLTVVLVIGGLGVMAVPALDLRLSLPDAGAQPPGTAARDTYEAVAEHFGPGYNSPLIITTDIIGSRDPLGQMDRMAAEIRQLPGVAAVPLATPNEKIDTGIIQVFPAAAGDSESTERLVHDLRALSPHFERTYGSGIAVTGMTAIGIDLSEKLSSALLPFGVIVVGLTLVLLAMVFRSVWVPLKAAVGYLLSVGATFGAVTFVFGQGHFAEFLGLSHVGTVINFLPILLMAILFGLAMDYEVFLVSRMREEYSHHRDARRAIESGFSAVSPVVIAAAVIMIAVFAAFVPHGDSNIKPIAFGLAIGVFVDAFLVRMTLVPAVMALLGQHAWWLPRGLARRLPELDVEGTALYREIRLADWPGTNTQDPRKQELVSAQNLHVPDDEHGVFGGVRIHLLPGRVLAVTTEDTAAATALLYTLSGRLTDVDGDLRVLGQVLPQHARAVRKRTALIACRSSTDPAGEVAEALREGIRLVLLDGLDAVADSQQRARLAQLFAAASHVPADQGTAQRDASPSFIVTSRDQQRIRDLMPEHRFSILPLTVQRGLAAKPTQEAVQTRDHAHLLEV